MAILLSLIVKLIQIEFVCHSHSRFSFYELNNPLTTMLHIICTKSKEDHISPAEEKQMVTDEADYVPKDETKGGSPTLAVALAFLLYLYMYLRRTPSIGGFSNFWVFPTASFFYFGSSVRSFCLVWVPMTGPYMR